jgi:uncharacterized protein (DUF1499 family)
LLPLPSSAFPNALPEAASYADRPKRRGPKPPDLGLLPNRELNRYGDAEPAPSLRSCKGAPNCFSTTGDPELDTAFLLKPWRPPPTTPLPAASAALLSVLSSYPPGQSGIDGGGFSLVTPPSSPPGYVQATFESLKNGYNDDLELAAVAGDGGARVLVRSSSRVGSLDFGVNARRLNWIAARLRELGWDAPEITAKTHPDYFAQNYSR